jgi:hypothetical protein
VHLDLKGFQISDRRNLECLLDAVVRESSSRGANTDLTGVHGERGEGSFASWNAGRPTVGRCRWLSEEDDRITARITTSCEGHEASPSRQWEPPHQLRDLPDGPAIRRRVREEEDDALESEVALLSTDPPLKGLDVAKARFGLDEGAEIRTCDHDVGAAEVALDGDSDLRAPAERR